MLRSNHFKITGRAIKSEQEAFWLVKIAGPLSAILKSLRRSGMPVELTEISV